MFSLEYIYWRVFKSRPQVVCEVGVNSPDRCSVRGFIKDGSKAILVEPLPWLAMELRLAFPSAEVHEAVCGDSEGTVRLFDRGEGSWIESVPRGTAPDEHERHSAMKREEFDPKFIREVRSVLFSEIDPGNIDVLCVDTEGAEWFVLNNMIYSNPNMISLETHFTHSGWINPFMKEIDQRMDSLGYTKIAQDVSDTLWIL
jgi:hypothetical protein